MSERNFDERPYSPDEQRVADWMRERIPGIGTGDDPIGFVLAAYDYLHDEWMKLTVASTPSRIGAADGVSAATGLLNHRLHDAWSNGAPSVS